MKRLLTLLGTIAILCIAQGLILSRSGQSQVTTFQADQNFINNLVTQVTNNVNATLRLVGDTNGVPTSNQTNHFSLTSDSSAGAHKITNLAAGTVNGDGLAFKLNHLNDLATATGDYSLGTHNLLAFNQPAGLAQFDGSGNLVSAGGGVGIGTLTGIINIMQAPYNAKGDGTTDDTIAIAAAAAACKDGQALFIPYASARFKITDTITFTTNCQPFGSGYRDNQLDNLHFGSYDPTRMSGSVIYQATPNKAGLVFDPHTAAVGFRTLYNLNLSQFAVVGPGSGTANGIQIGNSTSSPEVYFTFANLDHIGVGNFSTGLWLFGQDSNIISPYITANTVGMLLKKDGSGSSTNDIYTTQPNFWMNDTSVVVERGQDDVWVGGVNEGETSNGIVLTDCDGCTLMNGYTEGTPSHGAFTGDAIQANSTNNMAGLMILNWHFSLLNNTATNNIHLKTGTSRTVAIGNRGFDGTVGVMIDSGVQNTSLSDNNFQSTAAADIWYKGASCPDAHCAVVDNTGNVTQVHFRDISTVYTPELFNGGVRSDAAVAAASSSFAQITGQRLTLRQIGVHFCSDIVENSSTTITSASCAWTQADVGRSISGANIPGATTISSVTNATTAIMSAAATATTSPVVVTLGADEANAGSIDYDNLDKGFLDIVGDGATIGHRFLALRDNVSVPQGYLNGRTIGTTAYYSAAGTAIAACDALITARDWACVSDETSACTVGNTYASGGGNKCMVQCNGTNWKVNGVPCY